MRLRPNTLFDQGDDTHLNSPVILSCHKEDLELLAESSQYVDTSSLHNVPQIFDFIVLPGIDLTGNTYCTPLVGAVYKNTVTNGPYSSINKCSENSNRLPQIADKTGLIRLNAEAAINGKNKPENVSLSQKLCLCKVAVNNKNTSSNAKAPKKSTSWHAGVGAQIYQSKIAVHKTLKVPKKLKTVLASSASVSDHKLLHQYSEAADFHRCQNIPAEVDDQALRKPLRDLLCYPSLRATKDHLDTCDFLKVSSAADVAAFLQGSDVDSFEFLSVTYDMEEPVLSAESPSLQSTLITEEPGIEYDPLYRCAFQFAKSRGYGFVEFVEERSDGVQPKKSGVRRKLQISLTQKDDRNNPVCAVISASKKFRMNHSKCGMKPRNSFMGASDKRSLMRLVNYDDAKLKQTDNDPEMVKTQSPEMVKTQSPEMMKTQSPILKASCPDLMKEHSPQRNRHRLHFKIRSPAAAFGIPKANLDSPEDAYEQCDDINQSLSLSDFKEHLNCRRLKGRRKNLNTFNKVFVRSKSTGVGDVLSSSKEMEVERTTPRPNESLSCKIVASKLEKVKQPKLNLKHSKGKIHSRCKALDTNTSKKNASGSDERIWALVCDEDAPLCSESNTVLPQLTDKTSLQYKLCNSISATIYRETQLAQKAFADLEHSGKFSSANVDVIHFPYKNIERCENDCAASSERSVKPSSRASKTMKMEPISKVSSCGRRKKHIFLDGNHLVSKCKNERSESWLKFEMCSTGSFYHSTSSRSPVYRSPPMLKMSSCVGVSPAKFEVKPHKSLDILPKALTGEIGRETNEQGVSLKLSDESANREMIHPVGISHAKEPNKLHKSFGNGLHDDCDMRQTPSSFSCTSKSLKELSDSHLKGLTVDTVIYEERSAMAVSSQGSANNNKSTGFCKDMAEGLGECSYSLNESFHSESNDSEDANNNALPHFQQLSADNNLNSSMCSQVRYSKTRTRDDITHSIQVDHQKHKPLKSKEQTKTCFFEGCLHCQGIHKSTSDMKSTASTDSRQRNYCRSRQKLKRYISETNNNIGKLPSLLRKSENEKSLIKTFSSIDTAGRNKKRPWILSSLSLKSQHFDTKVDLSEQHLGESISTATKLKSLHNKILNKSYVITDYNNSGQNLKDSKTGEKTPTDISNACFNRGSNDQIAAKWKSNSNSGEECRKRKNSLQILKCAGTSDSEDIAAVSCHVQSPEDSRTPKEDNASGNGSTTATCFTCGHNNIPWPQICSRSPDFASRSQEKNKLRLSIGEKFGYTNYEESLCTSSEYCESLIKNKNINNSAKTNSSDMENVPEGTAKDGKEMSHIDIFMSDFHNTASMDDFCLNLDTLASGFYLVENESFITPLQDEDKNIVEVSLCPLSPSSSCRERKSMQMSQSASCEERQSKQMSQSASCEEKKSKQMSQSASYGQRKCNSLSRSASCGKQKWEPSSQNTSCGERKRNQLSLSASCVERKRDPSSQSASSGKKNGLLSQSASSGKRNNNLLSHSSSCGERKNDLLSQSASCKEKKVDTCSQSTSCGNRKSELLSQSASCGNKNSEPLSHSGERKSSNSVDRKIRNHHCLQIMNLENLGDISEKHQQKHLNSLSSSEHGCNMETPSEFSEHSRERIGDLEQNHSESHGGQMKDRFLSYLGLRAAETDRNPLYYKSDHSIYRDPLKYSHPQQCNIGLNKWSPQLHKMSSETDNCCVDGSLNPVSVNFQKQKDGKGITETYNNMKLRIEKGFPKIQNLVVKSTFSSEKHDITGMCNCLNTVPEQYEKYVGQRMKTLSESFNSHFDSFQNIIEKKLSTICPLYDNKKREHGKKGKRRGNNEQADSKKYTSIKYHPLQVTSKESSCDWSLVSSQHKLKNECPEFGTNQKEHILDRAKEISGFLPRLSSSTHLKNKSKKNSFLDENTSTESFNSCIFKEQFLAKDCTKKKQNRDHKQWEKPIKLIMDIPRCNFLSPQYDQPFLCTNNNNKKSCKMVSIHSKITAKQLQKQRKPDNVTQKVRKAVYTVSPDGSRHIMNPSIKFVEITWQNVSTHYLPTKPEVDEQSIGCYKSWRKHPVKTIIKQKPRRGHKQKRKHVKFLVKICKDKLVSPHHIRTVLCTNNNNSKSHKKTNSKSHKKTSRQKKTRSRNPQNKNKPRSSIRKKKSPNATYIIGPKGRRLLLQQKRNLSRYAISPEGHKCLYEMLRKRYDVLQRLITTAECTNCRSSTCFSCSLIENMVDNFRNLITRFPERRLRTLQRILGLNFNSKSLDSSAALKKSKYISGKSRSRLNEYSKKCTHKKSVHIQRQRSLRHHLTPSPKASYSDVRDVTDTCSSCLVCNELKNHRSSDNLDSCNCSVCKESKRRRGRKIQHVDSLILARRHLMKSKNISKNACYLETANPGNDIHINNTNTDERMLSFICQNSSQMSEQMTPVYTVKQYDMCDNTSPRNLQNKSSYVRNYLQPTELIVQTDPFNCKLKNSKWISDYYNGRMDNCKDPRNESYVLSRGSQAPSFQNCEVSWLGMYEDRNQQSVPTGNEKLPKNTHDTNKIQNRLAFSSRGPSQNRSKSKIHFQEPSQNRANSMTDLGLSQNTSNMKMNSRVPDYFKAHEQTDSAKMIKSLWGPLATSARTDQEASTKTSQGLSLERNQFTCHLSGQMLDHGTKTSVMQNLVSKFFFNFKTANTASVSKEMSDKNREKATSFDRNSWSVMFNNDSLNRIILADSDVRNSEYVRAGNFETSHASDAAFLPPQMRLNESCLETNAKLSEDQGSYKNKLNSLELNKTANRSCSTQTDSISDFRSLATDVNLDSLAWTFKEPYLKVNPSGISTKWICIVPQYSVPEICSNEFGKPQDMDCNSHDSEGVSVYSSSDTAEVTKCKEDRKQSSTSEETDTSQEDLYKDSEVFIYVNDDLAHEDIPEAHTNTAPNVIVSEIGSQESPHDVRSSPSDIEHNNNNIRIGETAHPSFPSSSFQGQTVPESSKENQHETKCTVTNQPKAVTNVAQTLKSDIKPHNNSCSLSIDRSHSSIKDLQQNTWSVVRTSSRKRCMNDPLVEMTFPQKIRRLSSSVSLPEFSSTRNDRTKEQSSQLHVRSDRPSTREGMLARSRNTTIDCSTPLETEDEQDVNAESSLE